MAVSVLTDLRVARKERVYFLLSIMLGTRMDEANRAQWQDIDWTAREIFIRGTKTELAETKMSIPPALMGELIELYRQREDSDFLFPGASSRTRGKKIYSRRRLFEKIRRLVLERYGRQIKLTPKDLRDIFASDAASQVRDPETLMHMMRHSSLTTTTKYLRGVKERMAEAAKGIGQQWVMMLDQDDEMSGANFRGQSGANLYPNFPLLSNRRETEDCGITLRDITEKSSGGGQTRTVDSADMSRVL